MEKKKFWVRTYNVTIAREHDSLVAPAEALDVVNMLCHNLLTLPNKQGTVKVELVDAYTNLRPAEVSEVVGESKTAIMHNIKKEEIN